MCHALLRNDPLLTQSYQTSLIRYVLYSASSLVSLALGLSWPKVGQQMRCLAAERGKLSYVVSLLVSRSCWCVSTGYCNILFDSERVWSYANKTIHELRSNLHQHLQLVTWITSYSEAFFSGLGVALSILDDQTSSLVGVAISASLLPPAVNCGMLLIVSALEGGLSGSSWNFDWHPERGYEEAMYNEVRAESNLHDSLIMD